MLVVAHKIYLKKLFLQGTSGGICEKYKTYTDGSAKSLNTGLVTFKNYGSVMPAKVTHITFAHELGHNFGSPVGILFKLLFV